MKLSKVLHVGSVIAGVWGILALIGAWLAGEGGTILGYSQQHCFYDAIVMMLIAIWLSISTIHHMKLEEKGKMI